jgi:hypothetical protein
MWKCIAKDIVVEGIYKQTEESRGNYFGINGVYEIYRGRNTPRTKNEEDSIFSHLVCGKY